MKLTNAQIIAFENAVNLLSSVDEKEKRVIYDIGWEAQKALGIAQGQLQPYIHAIVKVQKRNEWDRGNARAKMQELQKALDEVEKKKEAGNATDDEVAAAREASSAATRALIELIKKQEDEFDELRQQQEEVGELYRLKESKIKVRDGTQSPPASFWRDIACILILDNAEVPLAQSS